jgi:hypothetical protein
MAMTNYLMYNKLNYMEGKRLPKIASNSNQNHFRLDSSKDGIKICPILAKSLGCILQDKDNIKNTITSKFKGKLWCNKELEDKRKLRYYKEVINFVNWV